jgi:hypothetical protein
MLEAWGSTCGRCRPKTVLPKSPTLIASDEPSLELAWLVVLSSSDEDRVGELYPLDQDTLILSRQAANAPPHSPGQLAFADDFMSSGHSTLKKNQNGRWSIEDRSAPSPSANGTFVNSHQVAPGEAFQLCDGDIVRLGTTELFFRALHLPGANTSKRGYEE